jgi:hypothetical protein
VLVVLGILLALLVMIDAVRTVVNITAQKGPIARTVHRIGRQLARRLPGRWRSSAGLVITFAILVSWTLGLWLAWTIALLDPAVQIVETADGTPARGLLDAVYLAGFSIFTLGTGDLGAGTTTGRLVTVLASGTGLFTVSVEVTYLVALTSAAAHERKTARLATALGGDVRTIVSRSWDGESFRQVEPILQALARDLSELAESHRTFPVLHDVLPRTRSSALGPSLLALSDAIDVMHRSAPARSALTRLTYEQLVVAVDGVLSGLPDDGRPHDDPPAADPDGLLAGLGCVPSRERSVDEAIAARRRGLFRLAVEEGWRDAALAAIEVD